MKVIGLIGGMSWESSIIYYRILNEQIKQKLGGLASCECIMYSVNFAEIEKNMRIEKWDLVKTDLLLVADKIKNAGADLIVICTNTMHRFADDIQSRTGLKVIHIASTIGEKISTLGLKTVGLLGTKFVMQGEYYKNVLLNEFNINTVVPNPKDIEIVNNIIFNELCQGIINKDSKKDYLRIIKKLEHLGAEGIILGCTEIPLLIRQKDLGIPVFDTTTIHAKSAIKYALN